MLGSKHPDLIWLGRPQLSTTPSGPPGLHTLTPIDGGCIPAARAAGIRADRGWGARGPDRIRRPAAAAARQPATGLRARADARMQRQAGWPARRRMTRPARLVTDWGGRA